MDDLEFMVDQALASAFAHTEAPPRLTAAVRARLQPRPRFAATLVLDLAGAMGVAATVLFVIFWFAPGLIPT